MKYLEENFNYKELLIKRLATFGYIATSDDDFLLEYSFNKARNYFYSMLNFNKVPVELTQNLIDLATYEVLFAKYSTGTLNIDGLILDGVIDSIKEGDTTIKFDTGKNVISNEDRFLRGLQGLLSPPTVFSSYAKVRFF